MSMSDISEWEPTVQKTVLILRNVLGNLHEVWEEIGFAENTRKIYCEQAYSHIEDLLNDMVTESKHRRDALLDSVKQLMEEIALASKELGTNLETTGYEHLPLIKVEEILCSDLQKLEYCREQRLAQLNKLLTKERGICKTLGSQPIGIKEHLPSEEELNSFKLYLEKQEGEKNRLESIFKEMRRTIIKMMDDLGVMPSVNFEHLACNDPDNFVLSSNNMTKLRQLQDQFKSQVEEAKQHVEDLKQELITLWKYLDEPVHVCQSFLDSCVGYNMSTINALSAELKRCKEKRRENIAKYVSQVRTELVKLWDVCKYSEDQRKYFTHFYSNTYTEELLTLHELEVERMQKFYQINKSIFDLLEVRENLWTKMKELLQRANDPDRFYNRGGQLLTEEKERKTIQKKLPKIEEELLCLIKEYENTHGESFNVNGTSIEELLKESWENLNEEKKTVQKARKEGKDKSIKKITLSASKKAALSGSKRTPGILSTRRHTPLSTSKRKLLFSPSPNTSTKRTSLIVPGSGSEIRKCGKISRKLLTPGYKNVRSKSVKSNQKKENSVSHNSTATDSTYSLFKEHLEERRELRSSLLPEQVLANATKSSIKTPIRTPIKSLQKNLSSATTPSATPKLSQSQLAHITPQSPRIVQSSRLIPASTPLPIIF